MGFKSLIIILILSVFSISCSSITYSKHQEYSERDYQKLNSLGVKYPAMIYLLNGQTIRTNLVNAKVDSLHFNIHGNFQSIHLSEVEKVEILSIGDRIGSGLLWGSMGMLVGVASIALFLSIGSEGAALLAIYPTLGLTLTGFIWGYSAGNQEFIFNKR